MINITPLKQLPIPLLQWYKEHARVLPWRTHPTPYRVWISEIMLQQTRVTAVIPYFQRFLSILPSVADLAAVSDEQLMKLWEGLGYYRRAKNLKKAAIQIMEIFGGIFPSTYKEILSLSGIGEYTAGAIASIAFGIPVPAVDGNVLRVAARITGFQKDIAAQPSKQILRSAIGDIIPTAHPGNFNQAFMELGATVCLPNGAPLCDLCPAASFCTAYLLGKTEELPIKSPKKPRRIEERTVFLLFYNNAIALCKRPDKGLLSGLWEFPNVLGDGADSLKAWGILPGQTLEIQRGKHIFTHVEWHMTAKAMILTNEDLPNGWIWATQSELQHVYALPSAFAAFSPLVERYMQSKSPY